MVLRLIGYMNSKRETRQHIFQVERSVESPHFPRRQNSGGCFMRNGSRGHAETGCALSLCAQMARAYMVVLRVILGEPFISAGLKGQPLIRPSSPWAFEHPFLALESQLRSLPQQPWPDDISLVMNVIRSRRSVYFRMQSCLAVALVVLTCLGHALPRESDAAEVDHENQKRPRSYHEPVLSSY